MSVLVVESIPYQLGFDLALGGRLLCSFDEVLVFGGDDLVLDGLLVFAGEAKLCLELGLGGIGGGTGVSPFGLIFGFGSGPVALSDSGVVSYTGSMEMSGVAT